MARRSIHPTTETISWQATDSTTRSCGRVGTILSAPDGPVEKFRDLRGRLVLLATTIYKEFLAKSLSHTGLIDGVSWSMRFDWLARVLPAGDQSHFAWRIVASERDQLMCLDVPYFITSTSSPHLEMPGRGLAENCFERRWIT